MRHLYIPQSLRSDVKVLFQRNKSVRGEQTEKSSVWKVRHVGLRFVDVIQLRGLLAGGRMEGGELRG